MLSNIKFYFVAILSATAGQLLSQTNTAIVTTEDGRPVSIVDNINGSVVPVVKPNQTEGTPYWGDDWGTGTVFFKRGKQADSISLRFNIQENRLYFKREGITLLFADEVSSFRITVKDSGVLTTALFRNGYPGYNRLKSDIYYQVVSEGARYHLLRRLVKTLNDIYVYNGLGTKKYSTAEEWYVYDVNTGSIEKFKPGLPALIKKIPAAATQIKEIAGNHRWELKTKEELAALFSELNKKTP